VPGEGVLQVVDMRDTAIVGHHNFAMSTITPACPANAERD
jgi:hypothetical protein